MTNKQRTKLEKILPKINYLLQELEDLKQATSIVLNEIGNGKVFEILDNTGPLETLISLIDLDTTEYDLNYIIKTLEEKENEVVRD